MIVILGVIPVAIMEQAVHNYYKAEIINDKLAIIQTQSAIIANEISKYSDISDTSMNLFDGVIQQYSSVNDARILLVNPDYRIVLDTYFVEKNKTILSDNTVKAFESQKSISEYDKDRGCIEVATPVFSTDKTIMGVLVIDLST